MKVCEDRECNQYFLWQKNFRSAVCVQYGCTFTFTDIKNEVNQTELTVMGYRDFDTGVNTR